MKKNALVFGVVLVAASVWPALSFAATGAATQFKVTIEKIELCTGNGSGNGCDNSYVVGTGTKSFDIASATAGGDVGAFVSNTDGVPLDVTYNYVRVTLSRTFTITGSVTVAGLGTCYTDGTQDATGTTLATVAKGTTTAPATSETTIAGDAGTYDGTNPSYSSAFDLVSSSTFTYTIALSSPFTRTSATTAPTVSVSFDTQNALGALNSGGCIMFPNSPGVTVTIQ